MNRLQTYFGHITSVSLLFSLLLSSLSALAEPVEDVKAETIIAAVPASFPPYYQLDDKGYPEGFAIDMMNAVAARAKLHVDYQVEESWKGVFKAVRAGKADLIPNVGASKSRSSFLDFSSPVETFHISLFVRESSSVRGIDELAGKKIGAVRTNIGYKVIVKNKSVVARPYDSFEQALFALLSGQIEGLVYPEGVAWKLLSEAHDERRVVVAGAPLAEVERVIGIAKGNDELLARINRSVSEIVDTEEYRRIYKKWFQQAPPFWTVEKLLWLIASITIGLIIGGGIWRYYTLLKYKKDLDKTVDLRTKELTKTINEYEVTAKKLQERENQLEFHFANTPLAAVIWDRDFRAIEWNAAAERIFGFSKEEALGKHAIDLIVPRVLGPQIDDIFQALLEQVGGSHSINDNITADGRTILCEWFNTTLRDENGIPYAVTSLAQDITAKNAAEQRLQSVLAYNNAIIDSSPIGIAIFNEAGKSQLANQAFSDIIDRLGEDTEQLDISENPMWKKYGLLEVIDTANSTQSKERLEIEVLDKHGEQGYMDCIIIPVIVHESHHLLVMVDDISERKLVDEALRRSEQSYATAETIARLGSWHWNIANDKLSWTDEIYRIFGYEPQSFPATNDRFMHAIYPDDQERVAEAINQAVADPANKYDIEHRIILPSGEERIVHEQGSVYRDANGKPTYMIGTVQEITDRKRVETELLAARDESEKANLAKSAFLANMSHELRTPLHGILSFAQFGTDKLGTVPEEKLRKYFNQITASGQRLKVLLDDLLDLSKLEAGKMVMNLTSNDIRPIIETCVDEQQALIFENHLNMQLELDEALPQLSCDENRIGQVVMNILSNAIKFSPKDGRVVISASMSEILDRDGNSVDGIHVRITDDGPGIPVGEEDIIFKKFMQSSNNDISSGGTGLGLAITQELIHAHHGRIWCENLSEGGAAFHFLLPLNQRELAE